MSPLAVGGALQAELLCDLVRGVTGKHYPVGCFVSLARRGLIDAQDVPTDAGRVAAARLEANNRDVYAEMKAGGALNDGA